MRGQSSREFIYKAGTEETVRMIDYGEQIDAKVWICVLGMLMRTIQEGKPAYLSSNMCCYKI